MGPKCTTGTYILQWFINDFAQENTLDIQYIKKEDKNKTKLENFNESILSHFFLQVFDYFFHNVMQQLITHIPTGLHKNYPIIISGQIRT